MQNDFNRSEFASAAEAKSVEGRLAKEFADQKPVEDKPAVKADPIMAARVAAGMTEAEEAIVSHMLAYHVLATLDVMLFGKGLSHAQKVQNANKLAIEWEAKMLADIRKLTGTGTSPATATLN